MDEWLFSNEVCFQSNFTFCWEDGKLFYNKIILLLDIFLLSSSSNVHVWKSWLFHFYLMQTYLLFWTYKQNTCFSTLCASILHYSYKLYVLLSQLTAAASGLYAALVQVTGSQCLLADLRRPECLRDRAQSPAGLQAWRPALSTAASPAPGGASLPEDGEHTTTFIILENYFIAFACSLLWSYKHKQRHDLVFVPL